MARVVSKFQVSPVTLCQGRVSFPACHLDKGAGEIGLLYPGGAGDDQVVVLFYPLTVGQPEVKWY